MPHPDNNGCTALCLGLCVCVWVFTLGECVQYSISRISPVSIVSSLVSLEELWHHQHSLLPLSSSLCCQRWVTVAAPQLSDCCSVFHEHPLALQVNIKAMVWVCAVWLLNCLVPSLDCLAFSTLLSSFLFSEPNCCPCWCFSVTMTTFWKNIFTKKQNEIKFSIQEVFLIACSVFWGRHKLIRIWMCTSTRTNRFYSPKSPDKVTSRRWYLRFEQWDKV